MFNHLPQGIKISISRSIKTSFERYIRKINWDEKCYDFDDFVEEWRNYSRKNSSWFNNIDDQMKADPEFHRQLAKKMNEMIDKIISTPPTKKQMEEIESLIKQLGIKDKDYCCKAEANYLVDKLRTELQRKNKHNEDGASEKNSKTAGIMHHQAFKKELPNKEYTRKEIEKIINRAKAEMRVDQGDYYSQDQNNIQ